MISVEYLEVKRVDMIKIDVQGAEYLVLEGVRKTTQRTVTQASNRNPW